MFRKVLQSGVFALVGVVGVLATYGWAMSVNKAASISDVMKASFGKGDAGHSVFCGVASSISDVMKASFGKGGFKAKITAAVKSKDYEEVAKLAQGWVDCVKNLLENKPPRGDEKAWQERASKFLKITEELVTAATNKDGKAVNAHLAAIGKLCGDCHKNHK
jgi:hypothetical protein